MENNEIILLIVGKSGCGETTITEYLKKFYDMSPLYSYTTRPKREKDEVGHTFISKDEIEEIELMTKSELSDLILRKLIKIKEAK